MLVVVVSAVKFLPTALAFQTNEQINKQRRWTGRMQNGLVVKAEVAVPPVAVGSNPLVYIHEKNKLIKH